MKKYFTFPCRENGYNTEEGRRVINKYIDDKIKGHKLLSIVRKRFVINGENWINFTVSYK